LDNPIDIIVTTLSTPTGSGKLSTFNAKKYFGTKESQRIRVINNNKLCLFYALELGRIWHDTIIISELKKKGKQIPNNLIKQRTFYNIRKNPAKQKQLALNLLKEVNIPSNLSEYGIDHIKIVQDHYDAKYPGLYRIVLLDDNPGTKPLWKGPIGRRFNVALYLENNHFDALKSISAYYGNRKYCPGMCEIS
jgi:hypothetical protein